MTLAEVEDYRLAKGQFAPFKVSLLTAVEEWIAGRARIVTKTVAEVADEFLRGRRKKRVAVGEAASFPYSNSRFLRRPLTSKRVEGAGFFHSEDRKYRMNKFASSFPGRIDQVSTHEIEVWLNGLKVSGRTRNNYRNAVLPLFRYARGKRY